MKPNTLPEARVIATCFPPETDLTSTGGGGCIAPPIHRPNPYVK